MTPALFAMSPRFAASPADPSDPPAPARAPFGALFADPAAPILTARLRLRPVTDADAPRWVAFFAGADARFAGGPMLARDAAAAHEAAMADWSPCGPGHWAVERRDDRAWLGHVALIARPGWEAPELRWSLTRGAGGADVAAEAARGLRDRAAASGVAELVCFLHPEDAEAAEVARRIGARPDPASRAPLRGAQVWRRPLAPAPALETEAWR
ncbi:MAG: hypothetical protein CML46_18370 [Rhodobacteraceae bacterium]|nr:hypothetical protein [Paracoccaceae bacterium]MBR28883.1 hypothetical protein [Paracoccaceae bacterium]